MSSRSNFTLGVCIPVWNRGEIFAVAFAALIKQLEDIHATIWIFDNGSDKETRDIIYALEGNELQVVHKVFFPQNMGIPYAVNVFAKAVQENCDFAGYQSPEYIMLMDADAYFKKPVADLLSIFTINYDVGLISGHDSIEHAAIKENVWLVNDKAISIKEKANERMLTMIMRKDEFLLNYPFPHYRNRDVDWEITQWNSNSLLKRRRKLVVATDYVLHLGIDSSTWNHSKLPSATLEEIHEVKAILQAAAVIPPEKEIDDDMEQDPLMPSDQSEEETNTEDNELVSKKVDV